MSELSPRALMWLRELVEWDGEVFPRLRPYLGRSGMWRVFYPDKGEGFFPDDVFCRLVAIGFLQQFSRDEVLFVVTAAGRKAVKP